MGSDVVSRINVSTPKGGTILIGVRRASVSSAGAIRAPAESMAADSRRVPRWKERDATPVTIDREHIHPACWDLVDVNGGVAPQHEVKALALSRLAGVTECTGRAVAQRESVWERGGARVRRRG